MADTTVPKLAEHIPLKYEKQQSNTFRAVFGVYPGFNHVVHYARC